MSSRTVTAANMMDACVGITGMSIGRHDCTLTSYIEIYASGRDPAPKIDDYERILDRVSILLDDGRKATLRTLVDQMQRRRAEC